MSDREEVEVEVWVACLLYTLHYMATYMPVYILMWSCVDNNHTKTTPTDDDGDDYFSGSCLRRMGTVLTN